ncbi:MAG: PKD domain-containing protein [Deltaproteobacteria bacterium]|nr:PKD domain-containing protein [Deltaproteobacteria bacterium]
MATRALNLLPALLIVFAAACGGDDIQNINNNPPTAVISAPVTGTAGAVLSVDGSGSSDIDGRIVTWSWDFGDGATASGEIAQHIYNAGGTFVVTLTVTDNIGDTGQATASILIDANAAPEAVISAPTTAGVGENIRFDGAGSTDDGSIVRYDWDFGDGTTSAGQAVDHAYASAGTFEASLTVYDDDGASDTATQTMVIEAGPAGYGGMWRWYLTDESLRTDTCGTFQDSELRITLNGNNMSVEELAGGSTVQTYTGMLNATQWQVSYTDSSMGIPITQIITATFDTATTFTGVYSIDTGGLLNCVDKPVAGTKL